MHGVAVINITSLTPIMLARILQASRVLRRLTSLRRGVGQRVAWLAAIASSQGRDEPRESLLLLINSSPETVLDGDRDLRSRDTPQSEGARTVLESVLAVQAAIAVRLRIAAEEELLDTALNGAWDALLDGGLVGVACLAAGAAFELAGWKVVVEGTLV